ncbi:MAG TPA: ABC transporter permease [Thermoanaerobaculia bacterium]|nr:ABC transporter permease [Thermoanaerobaculia bacterium]
MPSFWREVRLGLRMLGKKPGHTLVAVVALGLGIGLTTAVFSIVYGIMFRGQPFPEFERVLALDRQNPSHDLKNQPADAHDYLDWCRRQRSFEGLAGYDDGPATVSGDNRPERLDGAVLTANALDLLRVRPILGRGFRPGEDRPGAPPVALLSHRLWQSHYGGDPGIVGKTVRINGQATTVAGVMGPDFRFPSSALLWTPLVIDPGKAERGKGVHFFVFGRLRTGVTADQAAAEMAAIAQALACEHPRTNRGWTVSAVSFTDHFIPAEVRRFFFSMLAAVGCVLLIACINVASLTMSRVSQRTREIAIRGALGAGRWGVVRQLLIESLVVALLGTALGLALAWQGVALFNAVLVAMNPPTWLRIAVDGPALLFTLGLMLAAILLSGLLPALQVSRTRLNEVLKDEGRGSTSLRLGWLSRVVVVAELALSCALLVAAGLMVKSIVRSEANPLGFPTAHLLTLRVPLFEASYPKPADRSAFHQRLLARLREIPGVEAVAGSTSLPAIQAESDSLAVEGRAYPTTGDYPVAHSTVVSDGLFASLGVRPLAGREFERLDGARSRPVAVVNQSLARRLWPRESALGKRIRLAAGPPDEPWRTVVGVVPDLLLYGFDDKKPDGIFLPLAQSGPARLSYVLRTRADSQALVARVRAEVLALDKDTPIYFVKTMEKAAAEDRFFVQLFGALFSIFGLCALVLAAVGIYGVIAFSVERRTQEIGVRMALGARRGEILGLLMRQGALQLAVGLALGLPLAFGLAQPLGAMLFRVVPGDPAVFAGVAAALSAVALLASLVPGQKATLVDPLVALRRD